MDRRLVEAVVFFLVVVGGALIAAIYGAPTAVLGILCLLVGVGILGLLWAILTAMERWANPES